jgi:predicted DNA-binding protein
MTMNMKRTALFLRPDQLEKLEAISKKTGAPIAELIRRAIDAYLKSK